MLAALAEGNLAGRRVADLGSGTGRLAIGAALLGAAPVEGIEIDPTLVEVARATARRARVRVEFAAGDVASWHGPAEVVIMNPPFGAQRRHADRPFWDAALAGPGRSIYGFALTSARAFVLARLADAGALVAWTRSIPWSLPRVFAHHTRARADLGVDLWAVRTPRASRAAALPTTP